MPDSGAVTSAWGGSSETAWKISSRSSLRRAAKCTESSGGGPNMPGGIFASSSMMIPLCTPSLRFCTVCGSAVCTYSTGNAVPLSTWRASLETLNSSTAAEMAASMCEPL